MTGLLAALLLAQAVQPENWINWTNYGTRGTSTVQVPLTLPLSSTGPLLSADANTVSHVYWGQTDYTNYALQSSTISTGTAVTAPWTLTFGSTISTVAGAPDGKNWAEVVGSANYSVLAQFVTIPSSTNFTVRVAAAKPSGTGFASMRAVCSAGTVVSCSRSRSGVGTVEPIPLLDGECTLVVPDLGTTAEYLTLSGTCSEPNTSIGVFPSPGYYLISAGTTRFSMVQVEADLSPGMYLPTTTAAIENPFGLIDAELNNWTMNGTVPQVAANVSPFVPGKPGAGPYSAANSYQGPTTLGEWTGDWSITIVFKPASFPTTQEMVAKLNTAATTGWAIATTSGSNGILYVHDGAAKTITAANALTANGVNVLTVGKSGGNCYARSNGGAAAFSACGTMSAATAEAIRIGGFGASVTNPATTTTIYEILASTTPYSDALHTQRFNAVFGLLPGPVSVTRADAITYTANGFVWSSPPATMGVGASGAEVWKGSTNYALNSAAHPKTAEATGSLNTGAHVAWHTGTGTMTVAAGTATVTGLACTAVSPGTNCTFTVTVAGTMAITTSAGTVTSIQVEPGAYPTPYIATTGTATARAATASSVPISTTLGNRLCVSGTFKPSETWTGPSTQRDLWGIGQAGAAGSWRLLTEVGLAYFSMQHWDSAAAIKSYRYLHGLTGTGTARITACNNQGTFSVYIDGVQKTLIPVTITGTGLWTTNAGTLHLGNYNNTSEFWDGSMSGIRVCRGATSYSGCR